MNIMELYEAWYYRIDVQFEMVKFLKDRETAFISKNPDTQPGGSRMHKVHCTKHFQLNMRCFPLRKEYPYNIYHSVAKYEQGIPNQSLNFKIKSESQINKDWKDGQHIKEMVEYDLVIDIDALSHDDFNNARESAVLLHNKFMFLGVPHEIRFTGMGFHFVCPTTDLMTEYIFDTVFGEHGDKSIFKACAKIGKYLYNNVSEMIDLKIYDSRRVIKCPYSLSIYDEKDAYICLPILSSDELKTSTLNSFKVTTSKSFTSVRGRGTKIFNEGSSIRPLLELMKHDS